MLISYILEIAGMFLLPLLFVLITIYIGQRYGIRMVKKSPELFTTTVSPVVSIVIGLLTFLLGFTFQIASGHYDARKALILEEVSNIRATYLRAELLQEPISIDSRKLLCEYVDLWVELAKDPEKIDFAISRSQEILNMMWEGLRIIPNQERNTIDIGNYSIALTNLTSSFNKRISLFVESRIPFAVLLILYAVSFLSMIALGYQFGISGKGGFKVNLLLSMIFAMVIFLILALDHPETRLVKMNQKAIKTLQNELHEHTGASSNLNAIPYNKSMQ